MQSLHEYINISLESEYLYERNLVVAVLYFSQMITVHVFNACSFISTKMQENIYFPFQEYSKEYHLYIDIHAVARSIPNSYYVNRFCMKFSGTVQLLGVCTCVIVM